MRIQKAAIIIVFQIMKSRFLSILALGAMLSYLNDVACKNCPIGASIAV